MKPRKLCFCQDYSFPHQYGSGKCGQRERDDELKAKQWRENISREEALAWARAADAGVD